MIECKAKLAPMTEVKLSSKNQIVVPREARQALSLKAGAKLLVVVRGETVILRRKPKSYAKTIEGMDTKVYPSGYLAKERNSW